MRQRTTGLIKRGAIWHIDKQVAGIKLRGSTGTSDRAEAERELARQITRALDEQSGAISRTFDEAAAKYIDTHQEKRSLKRDILILDAWVPLIGQLALEHIHNDTLQPGINSRLDAGLKNTSVNRELALVRRILTLAARLWRDTQHQPWLVTAPLIQMLPDDGSHKEPISYDEQTYFFSHLTETLKPLALYMVNSGGRDQEICELRWEWEHQLSDGRTCFILPDWVNKNGFWRALVHAEIGQRVIESQRGKHTEFVFPTRNGKRYATSDKSWQRARDKALSGYIERFGIGAPEAFKRVSAHTLRHTFSTRLRDAGIVGMDHDDLMGHAPKRGDMERRYSHANVGRLAGLVDSIYSTESHKIPTLSPNRLRIVS